MVAWAQLERRGFLGILLAPVCSPGLMMLPDKDSSHQFLNINLLYTLTFCIRFAFFV